MNVKIEKKQIVITLPIAPRPSKSGKTTVIASTNGNIPTGIEFDGELVTIGVNAYIRK